MAVKNETTHPVDYGSLKTVQQIQNAVAEQLKTHQAVNASPQQIYTDVADAWAATLKVAGASPDSETFLSTIESAISDNQLSTRDSDSLHSLWNEYHGAPLPTEEP